MMDLLLFTLFNIFVFSKPVIITGGDENLREQINNALLSLDSNPIAMDIIILDLGRVTFALTTMDTKPCQVKFSPLAREKLVVKTAIWHEYGHCLGFLHSNDSNDIMYHAVWPFETYKQDNVDRFIQRVRSAR